MGDVEARLGPLDEDVSADLSDGDEDSFRDLMEVFTVAAQPFDRGVQPQELSDAYTMGNYWLAVAKDQTRRAVGRGTDFQEAKLNEEYMDAVVRGIDRALMVSMSLAKLDARR